MSSSLPRTLVLATSYAPELRREELRPNQYPRTDYVELSKQLNCKLLDYSIYDGSSTWDRYRALEKKTRLDFHLAIAGYRLARDYDVVMLMSEIVAIPYMMLQRLFGRRAASVYVSAHSSERQALLVRSLRLFSGLDLAVSNTRAQFGFLSEKMHIPKSRVRCVRYAADEAFFVPGPDSGRYIFSSGMAYRDYDTFVDAVSDLPLGAKIAAGGRGYSLQFRGSVPAAPSSVELLPPTDAAGMRELYQNAGVVAISVAPGRTDAAGCSAVLEGMCCGRPVVATATEGLRDYIRDGETGILVEPGSAKAFRDALVRVLEDRELGCRLGQCARAECESRLSLGALVNGLADAAKDACDCR